MSAGFLVVLIEKSGFRFLLEVFLPRRYSSTFCSRASLGVVADDSDEGDLVKKHQGGKLNIVKSSSSGFLGKGPD